MSSYLPLEFDGEEPFGNGDKRRNCEEAGLVASMAD